MSDERGGQTGETDGRFAIAWRIARGVLLVTGIAVLGVGLLVVFVPGTEDLLPIEAAIRALGSDYVVVAVVGLLAVGLSTVVVAVRHVRGVEEADPPAVEGVQSASYPGEAFDRAVTTDLGVFGDATPDGGCRNRLKEAAIRATMRADGCSRRDAERRIDEGDWTDDAVAAQYFADPHPTDRAPDRVDWRRGPDRESVRRTVDAIAGLSSNGTRPERENVEGRGTGE